MGYLSVFSLIIWYIWYVFICQMCGQLVMQIILIKAVLFFPARKQVFIEHCFVPEAYRTLFSLRKLSIKHVVFNSLVRDVLLSTKYSS